MPEQWQKALEHWDAWDKSIKETRAKIEKEHGNISTLLERAKTIWPEGVDDPLRLIQDAKKNREAKILWNLYDEVEDIGSMFIAKEIGLKSESWLHYIFLCHWIHSVIPELTQDYDPGYYLLEYLTEKEKTNVWPASRVMRKQGEFVIVDSVNWIRGKVSRSEIPTIIRDMKWPSSNRLLKRAAGGRPIEQDRIKAEAIVVALLKDKQGMKYREITQQFGWSEPESQYSKPGTKLKDGKLISQTAVNRVRLGREILHHK
jgi:hypothetical protein